MTSDEFQRILVALCSMQIYNTGNDYLVSLPRVMMIIHSQLHPDDKSKWEYDAKKLSWRHIGDDEKPGELP
jgi:hypothetical protein